MKQKKRDIFLQDFARGNGRIDGFYAAIKAVNSVLTGEAKNGIINPKDAVHLILKISELKFENIIFEKQLMQVEDLLK